jgi:tetratricopeptide (TPR) repeat protein
MTDAVTRLKSALSDRYTIEREIGSGGMATVYLAKDLKHERQVAIKVLRPELAVVLGPDRFLQEIKIAANLNHPHILPLLDSGSVEEQPSAFLYYVMPYVEGESLRDRLNRERQLPIDDALDIARDVALGLSHAHSHDVVHRDIKPENILLSGGTAVVADFGIARAITEAGGERLTETGLAVGTPPYMSPEQAAGDRTLDGRSDVYALGCVLYEMLAGQAPFTGPTVESIVRQHLTAEPNPVTRLRPSVPDAVARTLDRSLAKSPADRQATAQVFADELRSEAATFASGATGSTATTRFPYRTVGLLAASALLLLAGVYGLVLLLGLPDWVFGAAAGLAVLSLPVLLLTGHAEQNRSAAVPIPAGGVLGRLHGWISWRRFLIGTAVAFSALGVFAAGYMAMRVLGVGPAATLLAQGIIGERDALILADFDDFTSDSTLGLVLTEAIRTDLTQSPVVTLVSSADVAAALERMERPAQAHLPLAVAIEIAVRDGLTAVVAGEVHAAGTGYVLSARLVAAESNEVLTAVRATARDSTQIVDAIDQISAKLRERVGESLRTIRRSPPLSQVTTASLPALRRYTDALVANDAGDDDRALALLEEAVEIDTAFAMAYRKLGIILRNRGMSRARRVDVFKKAYEHRDRLTDRERYLAMATYNEYVTGENERAIQAYEAMLRLDPDDSWALNNLGIHYSNKRDHVRAVEAYTRAFEVDSFVLIHSTNLAYEKINLGDLAGSDSAIKVAHRLFPGDPAVAEAEVDLAYARRDYAGVLAIMDSLHNTSRSPFWRDFRTNLVLAFTHAVQGRPGAFSPDFANAIAYLERAGSHRMSLRLTAAAAGYDAGVRGSPEEALARLEAALERSPLHNLELAERPYGGLAVAFAGVGRTDRARQLLAEAERELDEGLLRQAAGGLHRGAGYVALAEGRANDAVTEFRLSDAELGCEICALHGLGTAYRLAGEPDSAIAVFERFVNTPYASRVIWDAVWLANVYIHLGELYEERGDQDSAINYYNEFVELWKDADPELQPRVQDVRQRIARMAGEPQR